MAIPKEKFRSTVMSCLESLLAIPKEKFRSTVMSCLESLLAIPDELWDGTLPEIKVTFKNKYQVFVGIRDTTEEKE